MKILKKKLKFKTDKLQDDSIMWEVSSVINLGFNRVGLYNWAGGGQNSMALNGLLSFNANYSKNKIVWENNIDIAYGVLKSGYGPDLSWFKNDDRIECNSKFGYRANNKWDYSALISFRSQFTYGYNSTTEMLTKNYFSNLLSPAYPVFAIGLDYKPNKDFTCFVSPGTFKMTIIVDDSLSDIGAFGVTAGKNIRAEIGGYLKISYQKKDPFEIKDLTFKTNLTLFSNYTQHPQNIDVTWETLSSLKIKKFLAVTISTYLIYDHDIQIVRFENDGITPVYSTRDDGTNYLDTEGNPIQKKGPITQFKESFGLGLSFMF